VKIDVYAVGLLADVLRFVHTPNRRTARRMGWYCVRRFTRMVRDRKWREIKSYCNGYLAEPTPWPPGLARCGSGWTKGRAYRDLQRRIERMRKD